MNDLNIDFATATLDDLDALTVDQLLGTNIADVDLTSNLPDGVFVFVPTKIDLRKREAKPEEGKKGGLDVNLSLKVVKCLQCADSEVDKDSLGGRVHFQKFPWHMEMGKQNMAKLILGALGVSYKDKNAIAEIGQDMNGILNQLIEGKVAFGATIKNRESGGFENCDLVFKEAAFIPAEKVLEYLD